MSQSKEVFPPYSPLHQSQHESGWRAIELEDLETLYLRVVASSELVASETTNTQVVEYLGIFCQKNELLFTIVSAAALSQGIILPEDTYNLANFNYSVYAKNGTFYALLEELSQSIKQLAPNFDLTRLAASLQAQKIFLFPKKI